MTGLVMQRSRAAWEAAVHDPGGPGGQGDFASAFSDVFDDLFGDFMGGGGRGGGRQRAGPWRSDLRYNLRDQPRRSLGRSAEDHNCSRSGDLYCL